MDEIIDYLIRFLVGEAAFDYGAEAAPKVGYTSDETLFGNYDLVIIPSGFFSGGVYGTTASLPALPLAEWEGAPVLFGRPEMEKAGQTLVLHADLVASAYFLLARYEEMVRREVRDVHGRFPGKESLPFRAGFIHRPVVDEYRLLLQKHLRERIPGPALVQPRLSGVEITHDVDAPFLYRSWKGFVRSLLHGRGLSKSIRNTFGKPENDPYYTFPRLLAEGQKLSRARRDVTHTLFFKAGGNTPFDKPRYNPESRDISRIAFMFRENLQANIGLHASYQAGKYPASGLIGKEKKRLEQAWNIPITCNRHHFLSSREPEDMEFLLCSGISHDYTMGYADVAGFRLGTSHPVRWINPSSRRLTNLCLHPLAIMDCTLDGKDYMALACEEARRYCLQLAANAGKAGGKLSILWHNSSLAEGNGSYQSALYSSLLSFLAEET
ncbi:polysaccharide deacetylase [Bacteroidia bacterium]|nr:polysaccharide deacetylase [Bacteroidia bacterium]